MKPHAADPSASYAAEVARLLWPEPWETPYVTRSRHRRGTAAPRRLRLPERRRPAAAGPGRRARLVDACCAGSGSGRSTLARPAARAPRALGPLARLRAGPVADAAGRQRTDPGADSIENHLAGCFGTEVRVGVLLGTRRVNQKPVLQVFDLDGRLLGYAKVGHNDLTAALVRARGATRWPRSASCRPRPSGSPRLLHHGRWPGLEVLVISPLHDQPRASRCSRPRGSPRCARWRG